MVKAIVFDLFGTLTKGFAKPESEIIKTFDLDVDEYFVEKFTAGTKFEDMGSYLDIVIKGLKLEDNQETREKLVSIFEGEIAREKISDNVPKILIDLKSKNYKLGVISNLPNPLYDILKKYNLKKYFDVVLYSYELGILKPSLKMFQLMLSKLGLNSDEVIMIGNTLKDDIEAAEKVGIKGILLDRKNNHPNYKKRITSLKELERFL